MQKTNFDAKRAQILKQIHADKLKAAAKAKKDAENQELIASASGTIVASDADRLLAGVAA